MNRPTVSRIDIDALERETGFGWGWFIVFGLVLLALGAVALLNLPPASTSLFSVGAFMLIGAIAHSWITTMPGTPIAFAGSAR